MCVVLDASAWIASLSLSYSAHLLRHKSVGQLLRPRAHVRLPPQGPPRGDDGVEDERVPGGEQREGHQGNEEVEAPEERAPLAARVAAGGRGGGGGHVGGGPEQLVWGLGRSVVRAYGG